MFSLKSLQFWHHNSVQNRDENDPADGPMLASIAPLGELDYIPFPNEIGRNDGYAQPGTWPKGSSDRYKWYNNAFWGNRLPDPYVGIGAAGPGYAGSVTQKMFWTQHSPEQKFIHQWSLSQGNYQYNSSMQADAQYIQQQQAMWAASAGNA